MNPTARPLYHRQQGAATLGTTLILTLATALMAYTAAKTTVQEQRMGRHVLGATQAHQLAEAALESGMAQLARKRIPAGEWEALEDAPDTLQVLLPAVELPPVATGNGELYQQQVRFERASGENEFIEVIAEVRSASGIQASVRQFTRPIYPFSRDLPPLLLSGCVTTGFGGAFIHPAEEGELAVATTQPPGGDCLAGAGLDLNLGTLGYEFATPDALWHDLFLLTKTEAQERSRQEADAIDQGDIDADQRSYYWVDTPEGSPLSVPGITLGSPEHPVWLVFSAAADCPALEADTTVYGIIYYETGENGSCPADGWGDAAVYGSVIVEGSLEGLSGGSDLYDYRHAGLGSLQQNISPMAAPRVAGTWRDF